MSCLIKNCYMYCFPIFTFVFTVSILFFLQLAIFGIALGALVGWPFCAVLGYEELSISTHHLYCENKHSAFLKSFRYLSNVIVNNLKLLPHFLLSLCTSPSSSFLLFSICPSFFFSFYLLILFCLLLSLPFSFYSFLLLNHLPFGRLIYQIIHTGLSGGKK